MDTDLSRMQTYRRLANQLTVRREPCTMLLALALAACGGGGGGGGGGSGGGGSGTSTGGGGAPPSGSGAVALPVISYYNAAPDVINSGAGSTLLWSVSGQTSLSINQGVGSLANATSSRAVAPGATTTYTLTASNAGGSTIATATVTVGALAIAYATVAAADLGPAASTNGDIPFPHGNAINTDISDTATYPVDPNSTAIINSIGPSTGLHPDFGPFPYGIPYIVVDSAQPLVTVTINPSTGYPSQSDIAPMPIPPDVPIEGGANSGGDSHVLVVDRSNNQLYEMWHAAAAADNNWTADQSSIFTLTQNNWRPSFAGQCDVTSADAAGLPIFPLLVRYDEVASGTIHHAIRMTVANSRAAYVAPAAHWASSSSSQSLPPMGTRLRLKASYTIPSQFSQASQTILRAMQTYGLIVADNGSNWYFTGATDPRWGLPANNPLIDTLVTELKTVSGDNFEVVQLNNVVSSCPP